MKLCILFSISAVVIAALISPIAWATARTQHVPEIKLGSVTVRSQKVIQVLQDIKLALSQPNSTDPKLANVVVCRIHDAVGSHSNQVLTCATNKTLNARRDEIQLAYTWPGNTIDNLNEVLINLPGQELNMQINGGAFHRLLRELPTPAPEAASMRLLVVPSMLLTGQGSTEALQLGPLKITGQPMIKDVLQIVKSGLQRTYSGDPQLADAMVCRLNAESDNPSDQLLTCAPNRVWLTAQGSLRAIMAGAEPRSAIACCVSGCEPPGVVQFSSAIDTLPGHYLQTSVDSTQLHKLLSTLDGSCQNEMDHF